MVKKLAVYFIAVFVAACTKQATTSTGSTSCSIAGSNVMTITVGPQTVCGAAGYFNEPCTSVKICTPGTSTCQTITDILVDTGSYGLRIYKSALSGLALSPIQSSGTTYGECAMFGSANLWGSVQQAEVYLAGESKVTVPIQVIDSSFGTIPSPCSTSFPMTPADAGFNGILGVGLFTQDCGSFCTTTAANQMYYLGTSNVTMTLANQVSNPVSSLSADNNGVVLQMPSVSAAGSASVTGCMILGVGTETNNTPGAVTAFPADGFANFQTTFNGTNNTQSFIDSGSNGLYFPASGASGLTDCGGSSTGFYCPTSTLSFSATNKGSSGTPTGSVSFQVYNVNTFIASGNQASAATAGSNSAGSFDWGLPFFYGRNVYVVINGKSVSGLGTGPFWAY